MSKVYLRLLEESDANISWKWRNDPIVWQLTGSKPTQVISIQDEINWIGNVLNRKNEKRYAICDIESNTYIGNVQLTNINSYDAEFHIFIGERKYWGKGYGFDATKKMIEIAFNEFGLQSVYLNVNKSNFSAIKIYQKAGFKNQFLSNDFFRMALYAKSEEDFKLSVFVMTYNHSLFIKNTLEGILNQSVNFNYDIVVGDDYSNDNTREIVLDFATRFPGKFKLIFYSSNIGAIANQNNILTNCTGKYIAMCEGDDYWTDPYKLQKQVDFLNSNSDYSICCHDYDVVNSEGSVIKKSSLSTDLKVKNDFDITVDSFFDHWVTKTLTVVFRRESLNIDFDNYKVVNDAVLFFNILQHGKGRYLNFNSGCYRTHQDGVWSSLDIKIKLIKSNFVYKEIYHHFPSVPSVKNAYNRSLKSIIDFIIHDDNVKDFNLSELSKYCISYLRTCSNKYIFLKFIYRQFVLKYITSIKIIIRSFFDSEYRNMVNDYRVKKS